MINGKKKKEVLLRLLLERSCNVTFFDYFESSAVNLHFLFLGKSNRQKEEQENRMFWLCNYFPLSHCHPFILKFLFSRP